MPLVTVFSVVRVVRDVSSLIIREEIREFPRLLRRLNIDIREVESHCDLMEWKAISTYSSGPVQTGRVGIDLESVGQGLKEISDSGSQLQLGIYYIVIRRRNTLSLPRSDTESFYLSARSIANETEILIESNCLASTKDSTFHARVNVPSFGTDSR